MGRVKDDWWNDEKEVYECPLCQKTSTSKSGIGVHHWRVHSEDGKSFKPGKGNNAWNKGKSLKTEEDVLCKNSKSSPRYVREFVIKHNLIDYKCERCRNQGRWLNETLTLHLDHINGDRNDQRIENLRFLCPNCHSQTETYCGKKKDLKYGKFNKKVSDEELKKALGNNPNIRQSLLEVGLDARGGNYERCKKLVRDFDIDFDSKEMKKVENNKCVDCGDSIGGYSKRCVECEKERRKEKTKIDWPDTEWLIKMTTKYSFLALSRRLGVSDNAIRKRIEKYS